MRINFAYILMFVFFFSQEAKAQHISIVTPNGEPIDCDIPFYALIKYDNDTTVELLINEGILFVDSNRCNSFIDIQIEPNWGQPYHNQYLKSQLAELDTIVINQTRIIRSQTPRFRCGIENNIDSILQDQLWQGDWLEDNDQSVNGISFWVYNADILTDSDKKFVEQLISTYCDQIDHREFKDKILFKLEPYTSGQDDHFNEGTVINRNFIDNQNTSYMKQQAEKYSLVVTIIIDWNRE